MNTEELIEKVREVLSLDPDITAWCEQTFGRKHLVCIDIDDNKPPDPVEDYPIIVVTDIRQIRGDSTREKTWELDLGVGVMQEEIETQGNTRTLTGFLQAEALRELAEDALYKAHIAKMNTNSETGSISCYPLFISGSTIPVTVIKSMRRPMPV